MRRPRPPLPSRRRSLSPRQEVPRWHQCSRRPPAIRTRARRSPRARADRPGRSRSPSSGSTMLKAVVVEFVTRTSPDATELLGAADHPCGASYARLMPRPRTIRSSVRGCGAVNIACRTAPSRVPASPRRAGATRQAVGRRARRQETAAHPRTGFQPVARTLGQLVAEGRRGLDQASQLRVAPRQDGPDR